MGDNTKQSADETIATDEIDGVKYQRMKMTLGADGTNDGDVAADNPIPVTGTVSVSNLPGTQPVSGPLTDAQLRATPMEAALAELAVTLKVLLHTLSMPRYYDASTGNIRVNAVTVASHAVTLASTVVSGLTKVNDIDLNRIMWAQNIRSRIS
jgi:hypothetical protein